MKKFFHNIMKDNKNQSNAYQFDFAEFEEKMTLDNNTKDESKKGLKAYSILLSSLILFSFIGFAVYGVYSAFFLPRSQNNNSGDFSSSTLHELVLEDKPDTQEPIYADGRLTNLQIAKKIRPTIVGVVSYQAGMDLTPLYQASGIILDATGYIVTNAYVVKDAAAIKVVLNNNETYVAYIIGYDTVTDLAVIKIDAENLNAAVFGNSDQVEIGEKVVAIGSDNGQETSSVLTTGYVSSINKKIYSQTGNAMQYIQTDAAIHCGNTGGALVNEFGQIIGINYYAPNSLQETGIGMAIAINDAKPVIEQLIQNGKVTGRASLGIDEYKNVDSVLAAINDIPTGVYIQAISSQSDLLKQGISKGDIITAINETSVTNGIYDIIDVTEDCKPGDTVQLTIYRQTTNRYFDVTVTLIESA